MPDRRMIAGLVAAAFAVVASACARTVPTSLPSSVSRSDSAGIRIVESIAPAWPAGTGWRVDSFSLDLGAPDGLFTGFRYPTMAARLSDGRIVVADAGAEHLYFFSSAGRFLYSVGSVGKIPGQFESLWGVYRAAGDTVVTFDVANSRITRFDPNGALVDTASLAVPPGSNGFLPEGMDTSGDLVVLRDQTPIPFPGAAWSVAQNPGTLIRFSVKGAPLDSVTGFSAGEIFGLPAPQAGGGTVIVPANRPFGRMAAVAVRGDTIWLGTGAGLSFTAWVAGRPVRIVRIAGPPAILPESALVRFKARLRAKATGSGVIDSVFAASIDSLPFPDYLPGHGRALMDATGHLWVQTSGVDALAVDDPGLRWNVFDPTGVWLGTVRLVPGFTPWEIGPGWVLGLWAPPEDGPPHVRIYPIRVPPPAGGS